MNAATDDGHVEREMAVALRRLAVAAARVGGKVAMDSFGKPVRVNLKEDGSNVSEIDHATERATIDCIRRQRPNDRCLAAR